MVGTDGSPRGSDYPGDPPSSSQLSRRRPAPTWWFRVSGLVIVALATTASCSGSTLTSTSSTPMESRSGTPTSTSESRIDSADSLLQFAIEAGVDRCNRAVATVNNYGGGGYMCPREGSLGNVSLLYFTSPKGLSQSLGVVQYECHRDIKGPIYVVTDGATWAAATKDRGTVNTLGKASAPLGGQTGTLCR